MIRAPMADQAYWDEWVRYAEEQFATTRAELQTPAGDPTYEPQYLFNLVRRYLEQMLRRYSRGDAIADIVEYFPLLLDAWEESERLGKEVWTQQQQHSRHAWSVNLDHYIVCFWLVGLALALEIPERLWERLLALVRNEGEDELLDRVIASRQRDRKIGRATCHPKPYKRLLEAVNAPKDNQASLLFTFVDKWYVELDRSGRKGSAAMYERPYWYKYPLTGAYFGFWCIEAVAAVKAFGIEDNLCVGHPHYPGDLLRLDQPTTHRAPLQSPPPNMSTEVPKRPQASTRWLSRLLGRD